MKTTAQLFKALSDETRLRIISLLLNSRELCVCDIMAVLDLPQSTVSRHLSYLRHAGLVDDRRQGIWMYYTINRKSTDYAETVFGLLADMLGELDQTKKDQHSLKEFLKTKEKSICR